MVKIDLGCECKRAEFEDLKARVMRLEGQTDYDKKQKPQEVRCDECLELEAHVEARTNGKTPPTWGDFKRPTIGTRFSKDRFREMKRRVEELEQRDRE